MQTLEIAYFVGLYSKRASVSVTRLIVQHVFGTRAENT